MRGGHERAHRDRMQEGIFVPGFEAGDLDCVLALSVMQLAMCSTASVAFSKANGTQSCVFEHFPDERFGVFDSLKRATQMHALSLEIWLFARNRKRSDIGPFCRVDHHRLNGAGLQLLNLVGLVEQEAAAPKRMVHPGALDRLDEHSQPNFVRVDALQRGGFIVLFSSLQTQQTRPDGLLVCRFRSREAATVSPRIAP